MTTIPLIPENAPFSAEQRAWLNGFFAGIFSRQTSPVETVPSAPAALHPLTILWGSQTGTAESLAKRTAKEANKRGFAATTFDMAQYDIKQLIQEKSVLILTSTYGDGEPPDNAKALWEGIGSEDAPRANRVRYAVLSLGDTHYEKFCQCGKDFDLRLEKMGARRVLPRVDCDLDYEASFTQWIDAALAALSGSPDELNASGSKEPHATSTALSHLASTQIVEGYSKKNPYPAKLLGVRGLNCPGSSKETLHVEISLENSGLTYEAGDALGVIPTNCPELVNGVLQAMGCDGEEAVSDISGSPYSSGGLATMEAVSLRKALLTQYDLGKPSKELLQLVAKRSGSPELARLIELSNNSELSAWLHGRAVLDVLVEHRAAKLTPGELVGLLKKLQPRLYSISSSPKAHPGAVHLTVGVVRYEAHGRKRKGVCSTFFADRISPSANIPVFVHRNTAFRPPSDHDRPMIMVGPGTGIAPFRAFLEERHAVGAKGKNWLFFGDQRSSTDFLYREELEAMQAGGCLTHLDLAFSRDQEQKVYVQNRMLEKADELFAWLEQGAHFYVCGDASRMAKDVDSALHQVIERAGKRTPAQAADYMQVLKAQKRYARDVY